MLIAADETKRKPNLIPKDIGASVIQRHWENTI